MTKLPIAQTLHRKGHWTGPAQTCTLDYDARFLRRKRLTTDDGQSLSSIWRKPLHWITAMPWKPTRARG